MCLVGHGCLPIVFHVGHAILKVVNVVEDEFLQIISPIGFADRLSKKRKKKGWGIIHKAL